MKLFGIIPVYGLLIMTGIIISIIGVTIIGKKRGFGDDLGIDLALWCVPLAVIGARLYYVAFEWHSYAADPVRILHLWEGGLAIYGGVIGGVIGGAIYSAVKKRSFFAMADIVAPFLILAQGIGRWGNFANQEAHGDVIVNSALQFFPLGVKIGDLWYYATFFYESLWDITGFILIFLYTVKNVRIRAAHRGRACPRGTASVLYLVWYGLGRSMIEGLRTDSLYIPGTDIRVSQALSLLLVLLGCAHLLCVHIKNKKHPESEPIA